MNKYEIRGLIEVRNDDLDATDRKASALVEKIRKILADDQWETTSTNVNWLKEQAAALSELMAKKDSLIREIEEYRRLQERILREEV